MRLLILLFPALAFAEYRAFELSITNANSGKTRTVLSTLDQYQYPAYHHLANGDTISYVNSWMCYGRTSGFQAICPSTGAAFPGQNPVTPNPTDPALQQPKN
jgi:hypothetical protein